MLKLEELRKYAAVSGIDPAAPVRIVSTEAIGDDALTVYYKTVDGTVLERMLFRADEAQLSLAQAGRPWAFDSSGDEFKLAAEAFRIHLAHLFDPMMAGRRRSNGCSRFVPAPCVSAPRHRHPGTWQADVEPAVRLLPAPPPQTPLSGGQPAPQLKPQSDTSHAYSSVPSPICRPQSSS